MDQSASNIGEHMKAAFGSSWKEVLCDKQLLEGKIDPGNPALLVISLSALRSLELLRSDPSLHSTEILNLLVLRICIIRCLVVIIVLHNIGN